MTKVRPEGDDEADRERELLSQRLMDVYFNGGNSSGSSAHLHSLGYLNTFYQNAWGLRRKCCDFFGGVDINNNDICRIKKSWPNNAILSRNILLVHFLVDRGYSDSKTITGDGELVAV